MALDSLARTIYLRLGRASAVARPTAASETLVLFFNTMWGQPIDTGGEALPDGCRLSTDIRHYHEAAAVVFHIPTLGSWPLPPKPPHQLWVAWSLECEENYPRLRDPAFMRQFDLTMTYRQSADVVDDYLRYYADAASMTAALRTPPRPKRADALGALFISSRVDQSGRLAYAAEVMRHLPVHSYGRGLRNRTLPEDRGRPTKLAVISEYAFTLAFENAVGEDYVTEKFYDPLVAGSVPVYLGAPNVDAFAPGETCFINAADYPDPRALAAYLTHLAADEAAYAAYFAWKERPFRAAFERLLAGQATHPNVRLARLVQARQELTV